MTMEATELERRFRVRDGNAVGREDSRAGAIAVACFKCADSIDRWLPDSHHKEIAILKCQEAMIYGENAAGPSSAAIAAAQAFVKHQDYSQAVTGSEAREHDIGEPPIEGEPVHGYHHLPESEWSKGHPANPGASG
jgi:hypothetical protein